jgi:dephospho-CoA kinase
MLRVGITGGIGSGKTTICRVWEHLGAFIIHADELAKELMVNSPEIIEAIKDRFGEKAYFSDGSLNRSWLSEQAFGFNRVKELNEIVHPAVFKASDLLMQKAEREGFPMAVREAAILLQYGKPNDLDKIVLVLSNKADRANRVQKRDSITLEHIEHRIASQPSYEDYSDLADIIIHNDGTLEDLESKARQTYIDLITI